MKEKIIEEIYSLIEDLNTSTTTILNKAIRLARLCDEMDYLKLFHGNIKAEFEEIRKVLEREGILQVKK